MTESPIRPLNLSEMTRVESFADVGAVIANPHARQAIHRYAETRREWGPGPTDPYLGDTLISLHGDPHFQRRRIAAKLFTKAARTHFELDIVLPLLREALASHLAESSDGAVDLLTFTRLVLVRLSSEVVGVPPVADLSAAERLQALSAVIGEAVNSDFSFEDRDQLMQRGLDAAGAFEREFYQEGRRIAQADTEPGGRPNIISRLVHADDGVESEAVLFREAMLFLIASSNTTTTALPHAVFAVEQWLKAHPKKRVLLESRPFCRRVIAETLRLNPPVPALLRQVTVPMVLPSGKELSAGEFVYLDLDSSARDTTVFGADADEFNPERQLSRTVRPYAHTFAGGTHMCVGRTLAMGDGDPGDDEADDDRYGILPRLLHEFYQWGIRLDESQTPEARTDTEKKAFKTFMVRFSESRDLDRSVS